MTRQFHYTLYQEASGWWVSQLLDFDLASQGSSPEEAEVNLRDALVLHFTPPVATRPEPVRRLDLDLPETADEAFALS